MIDCTILDDTRTNEIMDFVDWIERRNFALPYSGWHSFVFLDCENAMMFVIVYVNDQQWERLWYMDLVWRKHHVEDSLHEDLRESEMNEMNYEELWITVDFDGNRSCDCFNCWYVIVIMN